MYAPTTLILEDLKAIDRPILWLHRGKERLLGRPKGFLHNATTYKEIFGQRSTPVVTLKAYAVAMGFPETRYLEAARRHIRRIRIAA